MIELKTKGHPNAESYTPRQIAGCLFFVQRLRGRELAEILAMNALAARGKPQEIKKRIKQLTKDRGPGG